MKLHSWLALFAPSLFQIVRSADFDALDEWGSSPLSSLGHLEVTDSLDAGGPPSPPKQPQVPTDLREVNIMLNARHKAKQIGEDASMYLGIGWGVAMVFGIVLAGHDASPEPVVYITCGGTLITVAGFVLLGVGLAVYLAVEGIHSLLHEGSGPAPKIMAALNAPTSLKVQQQAGCVEIHNLADVYEGAAEQFYGVRMWARLFQDFVIHFENAQDGAHKTVTDHIASRNVTVWPTLPPLPKLPHVPTKIQKLVYDQEVNLWAHNNIMTIPGMKHAIESEYNDMHRRETLAEVYRRRNGTQFKESFDSVAFEKLSLTFLYRIGVPHFCVGQVPEAATVRKKMAPLRITQQVRADRQALVMNAQFEDRNAMTRAELL